jgi:hypothetical protein
MSEANSIRQSGGRRQLADVAAADVLGVVASPDPGSWPPPAPKAKRRRRRAATAAVSEPAPVISRRMVRVRVEGGQCPMCGQPLPAGRYVTVQPGGVLAHPVCPS